MNQNTETFGTAAVLLKELRASAMVRHENLSRDYTIPVIDTGTGVFRGSVTFNILTTKPFYGQKARPTTSEGFWKTSAGTTVVGYRAYLNIPRFRVQLAGRR